MINLSVCDSASIQRSYFQLFQESCVSSLPGWRLIFVYQFVNNIVVGTLVAQSIERWTCDWNVAGWNLGIKYWILLYINPKGKFIMGWWEGLSETISIVLALCSVPVFWKMSKNRGPVLIAFFQNLEFQGIQCILPIATTLFPEKKKPCLIQSIKVKAWRYFICFDRRFFDALWCFLIRSY